jgi:hypothetical protein
MRNPPYEGKIAGFAYDSLSLRLANQTISVSALED